MPVVLAYDDKAQQELQRIKKFAEQHPLSLDEQLDIRNGVHPAPGLRKEYCCIISNIRMVFSYEEHPMGWVRHLSVSSCIRELRYPSIHAVDFLMQRLGFKHSLLKPPSESLRVHEMEGEGIFNIMELIDNLPENNADEDQS